MVGQGFTIRVENHLLVAVCGADDAAILRYAHGSIREQLSQAAQLRGQKNHLAVTRT